MVLGLPDTNAKLADVIGALELVAARLAAVEVWRDDHERSKVERQRQVDQALAELRSMRKPGPR